RAPRQLRRMPARGRALGACGARDRRVLLRDRPTFAGPRAGSPGQPGAGAGGRRRTPPQIAPRFRARPGDDRGRVARRLAGGGLVRRLPASRAAGARGGGDDLLDPAVAMGRPAAADAAAGGGTGRREEGRAMNQIVLQLAMPVLLGAAPVAIVWRHQAIRAVVPRRAIALAVLALLVGLVVPV